MLRQAPDWFQDEMCAVFSEMRALPAASGYLEDGSPVYRLEDVAAKLGASQEEGRDILQQAAEDEVDGLQVDIVRIDPGTVHRKQ